MSTKFRKIGGGSNNLQTVLGTPRKNSWSGTICSFRRIQNSRSWSTENSWNCEPTARAHASALADIARRVASIDVLQCFATVGRERGWTKPDMTDQHIIKLQGARHPVLETQTGFVPNDVVMNPKRNFLLITGPNMGGKSTYLRTVALVCVLAQAGCFVPAQHAKIGLVDRVFTRVGASVTT